MVLLVHVILEELGVWVHGPQLVYLDDPAPFTHSFELDEGPVGGVGIKGGLFDTPGNKEIESVYIILLHDFKATGIEPSQDLGPGQHPVVSAGEEEIDSPGGVELGKDSFDNIIEGVDQPVEKRRVFSHDAFHAHVGSLSTTDKDSLVGQFVIHRLEEKVDVPEIVDPSDVHNGIELLIGLTKDVEPCGSRGDQGPGIGECNMTFNEAGRLLPALLGDRLHHHLPVHPVVTVYHCLTHFSAIRLGRGLLQEGSGRIIFGGSQQVGVKAEEHHFRHRGQPYRSEYHHPGEKGCVEGIDDKCHESQSHQVGNNNFADQEPGILFPDDSILPHVKGGEDPQSQHHAKTGKVALRHVGNHNRLESCSDYIGQTQNQQINDDQSGLTFLHQIVFRVKLVRFHQLWRLFINFALMKKKYTLAVQAALKAGSAILDVYEHQDFEVEHKPDQSPLTLADRRAHEIIVTALKDTMIPILSEEGREIPYMNRSWWPKFWLVDPLDGTKEFIARNGEFTVNIALVVDGKVTFGVVYAPVLKTLYVGLQGRGAYRCREEKNFHQPFDYLIQFSEPLPFGKTDKKFFRVVASRSHYNRETSDYVKSIQTGGKTVSLVNSGSSLKLCMVAAGEADIYPRLGPTMEWDTAAAHAVVKASGKNVYRIDNGEELVYNKENLLNPFFVVR